MKGFFPLTTTLLLLFQTAAAIEYTSTSQALPHEEPKDHYPDCSHWAKEGHCVFGHTRSDFMMNWCTKSCVEALELKPAEVRYLKENEQIFFDLEATNVYGDVLDFERFEGYVTVVVNAARDCCKFVVLVCMCSEYMYVLCIIFCCILNMCVLYRMTPMHFISNTHTHAWHIHQKTTRTYSTKY
mmetsp:Transcript_3779/g.5732  ORF Transcript_3779/g.5732 Transcript_3779/m.5732 type:complete len:184 (+) Transcript_3779:176-727(+)